MTRIVFSALLLVVIAVPAAAVADSGSDYVKYAKVRDRVQACVLDRQWRQLSDERRKQCRSLRKLYRLWDQPGESKGYHLHCLTAKCPPQPIGEPDPRAAIPAGADVYKP
jgi:hypothetical protein